jgi:hypothetical protein
MHRLVGAWFPAGLGLADGPVHSAYGWDELVSTADPSWRIDAYLTQVVRRTGREVLNALGKTKPLVLARCLAKERAITGPLVGRLLGLRGRRAERPRVEEIRGRTPAPAVIVGAAAWLARRIRLTSAVAVLSAADPVGVFQQFATLDVLSQGRTAMVVGRASSIEASRFSDTT